MPKLERMRLSAPSALHVIEKVAIVVGAFWLLYLLLALSAY